VTVNDMQPAWNIGYICDPIWQKGTYSLSTFQTLRLNNILFGRSMAVANIQQHYSRIVCVKFKGDTPYYWEVISTQSCTIGKPISPFLSDQVTYIYM